MSSTDVTDVAAQVSGITIDGPTAPPDASEILAEAREERIDNILGNEPTIETRETTVEFIDANGASTGQIPVSVLADVLSSDDSLFDSDGFRNVPVIDGQACDELVLAFSGSVKYDATDLAGQKMFRDLTLGKSVTLRIEGSVATRSGGWKLAGVGTDSEREVVTGKISVKVTDHYHLGAGEL